jgi:hypothetical protein
VIIVDTWRNTRTVAWEFDVEEVIAEPYRTLDARYE